MVERLREELQEELLDLKGNIRVFARVRPCLTHERKQQESSHRLFRFDRTDRGEGVLEMVPPDAQDVTGTMRPGKAMEWTFNRYAFARSRGSFVCIPLQPTCFSCMKT